MKQFKHILFDLDGTLLALDFQEFVQTYFQLLGKKMAELGLDPKLALDAVWQGTKAMIENDGSATNEQTFWSVFAPAVGKERAELEPLLASFYCDEFHQIRSVLREERNLRQMIDGLKAKGYTVSLATNPVFPKEAVQTRLSWLGLTEEDFSLVTSYENSSYCKPNLGYFQQVLAAGGFSAEECLMVGNNIEDDMTAKELGLSVYLVTDLLENPKNGRVEAYPHGDFQQLQGFFEALPPIQ